MHARYNICDPFRTLLPLSMFLALCACAPAQQRLTQASLTGDIATMNELLTPGYEGLDESANMELEEQKACPGHPQLTPLQAAACAGKDEALARLLTAKADPNKPLPGVPPLILALNYGHATAARTLIQAGAKPDAADQRGQTALMYAASMGDRETAELLLKNGASPKATAKNSETALQICADPALAKLLVSLGADPLAHDADGETGLHIAARHDKPEMAKFFLERGVDPGVRNRAGATALDIARGNDKSGAQLTGKAAHAQARHVAQQSAQAAQNKPAGSPAVAAVITKRLRQDLARDRAAGDDAAKRGRPAEALRLYAAALVRAEDLGGADDQDLRLHVVRYAGSLPQPPAMPEAAREHLVRGQYFLSKGQDMVAVERELTEAQRLAPWWAEGYYNLGIIQYGRGEFDEATRSLQLFMAAAPGDPRVRAAKDKIFEIRIAREQKEKLHAMQGAWRSPNGVAHVVAIDGDDMTINGGGLIYTLAIKETGLEGSTAGGGGTGPEGCAIPSQTHPVTGRYDADARIITLEYQWSNYAEHYHCVDMLGTPSNCCIFCDKVCDAATVASTSKASIELTPAQ
ncbi:MAG: ankyrin repeat domain-containing protein [Humidesulfovibrio sp.]|nr:ankyrin repeat domain-containing protein [Humidesulfovibrio sp.]